MPAAFTSCCHKLHANLQNSWQSVASCSQDYQDCRAQKAAPCCTENACQEGPDASADVTMTDTSSKCMAGQAISTMPMNTARQGEPAPTLAMREPTRINLVDGKYTYAFWSTSFDAGHSSALLGAGLCSMQHGNSIECRADLRRIVKLHFIIAPNGSFILWTSAFC